MPLGDLIGLVYELVMAGQDPIEVIPAAAGMYRCYRDTNGYVGWLEEDEVRSHLARFYPVLSAL
jgi:hypothetical protein